MGSQGSSKKRRSTRRSKKRIHDEIEYDDNDECNGHNVRNKHNKSTKHKKRRKSKSKRRKAASNSDSDGDYNPNNTDNSDVDIDLLNDANVLKQEGDVYNNLRKRRKVNGSHYIKTNGIESSLRPKTFNVAPNQNWFPLQSINKSQISNKCKDGNKNQNEVGPEAETQLFAQSCFELLQFREWISIGYQTKYNSKKHKKDSDKVQIVRCLLCDAEGTWTVHKPPRHKKGCDFIRLKQSFASMQPHFTNIPLMETSNQHNNEKQQQSMPYQPNIIPPTRKLSHLPPLPPQHHHSNHHRFIPPAFPPPFFTQIPPPMFPPNPSYHILPNQPPPLIQANSSNATSEHNKNNKKIIKTDPDKPKTSKNGKIVVKKQENENGKEEHDVVNKQSTPMMFPFGNQSPTMFPQNVGGMQSPLFSINNVPQTPNYLMSANGNNAFLPGPNPNAHNVGAHHSSLNNYHSFGHTASTLPMPLSLPMQSMMTSSTKDSNVKEAKSSNTSSSDKKSSSLPMNDSEHQSRSPTPHSRAQSLNPPISTITAMSGISQEQNSNPPDSKEQNMMLDNMPSFHHSVSRSTSSVRATMGSPTATLQSNPPQHSKSGCTTSVDS